MGLWAIILIAFLIGLGYLIKLRNYDIYDKEPFRIMLASFLVGGVVSIAVTLLFYQFIPVEHTFLQAFYKVGIIEELAKLVTFFLIYRIISKHFDEIVDGVIYMSCIALGFAVIENVSYAMSAENAIFVLAIRAITSTIGHMAFSGIMGVALFVHFKVHKNWLGIALSLLLAAFAHGFYDGVLFKPELSWSFVFVFGLIVLVALWILRLVLSFSRLRKPFNLNLFSDVEKTDQILCVNCSTRSNSKRLEFWKIETHLCVSCNNVVFDFASWKQMNRYYLPLRKWKSEVKSFKKETTMPFRFGENSEHSLNVWIENVSCTPDSLSDWLEKENRADKERNLNIPVIGIILKWVGLKYMVK